MLWMWFGGSKLEALRNFRPGCRQGQAPALVMHGPHREVNETPCRRSVFLSKYRQADCGSSTLLTITQSPSAARLLPPATRRQIPCQSWRICLSLRPDAACPSPDTRHPALFHSPRGLWSAIRECNRRSVRLGLVGFSPKSTSNQLRWVLLRPSTAAPWLRQETPAHHLLQAANNMRGDTGKTMAGGTGTATTAAGTGVAAARGAPEM
jgi:hypothetical protein